MNNEMYAIIDLCWGEVQFTDCDDCADRFSRDEDFLVLKGDNLQSLVMGVLTTPKLSDCHDLC